MYNTPSQIQLTYISLYLRAMFNFYGHIVSPHKNVPLPSSHKFDLIISYLTLAIGDTEQVSHEFKMYSFHDIAAHYTSTNTICCCSQHTCASNTTQKPVFTELECGVAHGLRPPARLPQPPRLAQQTSLPACLAGWLPETRRLAK